MKNLIIVFLLICSTLSYSQKDNTKVTRVNYTVEIMAGKNKPESKRKATAVLDIQENNSRFMDLGLYNQLDVDNIKNNEDMARPLFNWAVVKEGKTLKFYETIGLTKSYYEDDIKSLNWHIEPEIIEWQNYNVQKATCDYGGREWTIYFTQDIAVQGGPYKFVNLPGLVVKAWDANNEYSFEVINSENIATNWTILDNDYYQPYTKKETDKARKTNANKTYLQLFEERGQKVGEANKAFFNRKIGDTENPIEKDF